MHDKKNPNIEYPQINIPVILLLLLFIALYIAAMGFVILGLYSYIYSLTKEEFNQKNVMLVICLSILLLYLIYALIVNAICLNKEYNLLLDNHLFLYMLLLYFSFNIPVAILINIRYKKTKNTKNNI